MSVVPEKYIDLLQGPNFAHLATIMPDGSPQVTPVWFKYDGTHIIVNSARGRRKDKNLRERPSVALSILDPKNSYRYLEVRGKVVKFSEEGADEVIDSLAKAYMGVEKYPYRSAEEVRVTYWIEPTACSSMG